MAVQLRAAFQDEGKQGLKERGEMMNRTRKKGIDYLVKTFPRDDHSLIAVSRRFRKEESWTGKSAWWFDLPIKTIKENKGDDYHLLGERGKSGFVILKVPNKFLIENLKAFETRYKGSIRLHITAEGPSLLMDERGPGHVNFSSFEQNR